MSKHKYSREYLKRIMITFPQLDTPTDINTALQIIRCLSMKEMMFENNLAESTIKRRRAIVFQKTGFKTPDEFCFFFIDNNKELFNADLL